MLSTRRFNGRPRTHVRYFIVKLVLACSLVCFGRTFPPCRDKMGKHRVGSSRKDSNKILYIKDEYYWYFLHHQTFISNDTFHYFQDFCNVEKINENFHIACINFFLAFFSLDGKPSCNFKYALWDIEFISICWAWLQNRFRGAGFMPH